MWVVAKFKKNNEETFKKFTNLFFNLKFSIKMEKK